MPYLGTQPNDVKKNTGLYTPSEILQLTKEGSWGGSLELIESQTISSDTAQVDFTNIKGAKYDVHVLQASNIKNASDNQQFAIRMSVGGTFDTDNDYQRAIFTLQGCVIGDQVVGQQLGQTSYFSLSIEGLGLRGQSYNTGMPSGPDGVLPRNTNSFLIPNVYDEPIVVDNNGAGAITYTPVQTMAGSYDLSNPIELVCGNPVGKTINFKLFDNAGAPVADNANFNTIVRFRIELIPN